MNNQQASSKTIHIILWVAQVLLAAFFIMGAVMKFQPIERLSAMMPWTGQVPSLMVRSLGVVDLLGATGLILPSLLRVIPKLTPVTALCIIALMICAILFHVSRSETSVVGVNIFAAFIAAFIAWGRIRSVPIPSK